MPVYRGVGSSVGFNQEDVVTQGLAKQTVMMAFTRRGQERGWDHLRSDSW